MTPDPTPPLDPHEQVEAPPGAAEHPTRDAAPTDDGDRPTPDGAPATPHEPSEDLDAHDDSEDDPAAETGHDDASPATQRANRDAARYRRRLREAEAERDDLREQVVGLQIAEASRIAADKLAVGGDLFEVGGVQINDVLDDNGRVDADLVMQFADDVLAARPGLAKQAGWPDMGQNSKSAPIQGSGTRWGDVINPLGVTPD